jgi:hypothetical protein
MTVLLVPLQAEIRVPSLRGSMQFGHPSEVAPARKKPAAPARPSRQEGPHPEGAMVYTMTNSMPVGFCSGAAVTSPTLAAAEPVFCTLKP